MATSEVRNGQDSASVSGQGFLFPEGSPPVSIDTGSSAWSVSSLRFTLVDGRTILVPADTYLLDNKGHYRLATALVAGDYLRIDTTPLQAPEERTLVVRNRAENWRIHAVEGPSLYSELLSPVPNSSNLAVWVPPSPGVLPTEVQAYATNGCLCMLIGETCPDAVEYPLSTEPL